MTIALACATLPFTFAAQTPSKPSTSTAPDASTAKVKKTHKKHALKPAVKKSGTTTAAVKPMPSVKQ
jgi:hypothetical protein